MNDEATNQGAQRIFVLFVALLLLASAGLGFNFTRRAHDELPMLSLHILNVEHTAENHEGVALVQAQYRVIERLISVLRAASGLMAIAGLTLLASFWLVRKKAITSA